MRPGLFPEASGEARPLRTSFRLGTSLHAATLVVWTAVVVCLYGAIWLFREVADANYVRDPLRLASYRRTGVKQAPEAFPADAVLTGYYTDSPFWVVVRETPAAREKWTDAFRHAGWQLTPSQNGWSAWRDRERAYLECAPNGTRCVLGLAQRTREAKGTAVWEEAKRDWLGRSE